MLPFSSAGASVFGTRYTMGPCHVHQPVDVNRYERKIERSRKQGKVITPTTEATLQRLQLTRELSLNPKSPWVTDIHTAPFLGRAAKVVAYFFDNVIDPLQSTCRGLSEILRQDVDFKESPHLLYSKRYQTLLTGSAAQPLQALLNETDVWDQRFQWAKKSKQPTQAYQALLQRAEVFMAFRDLEEQTLGVAPRSDQPSEDSIRLGADVLFSKKGQPKKLLRLWEV